MPHIMSLLEQSQRCAVILVHSIATCTPHNGVSSARRHAVWAFTGKVLGEAGYPAHQCMVLVRTHKEGWMQMDLHRQGCVANAVHHDSMQAGV